MKGRRDGSKWEPQHRASVRHRVAVEAARMLYHREVKEYLHAKREAARRQGTLHLPSNAEVHEQLLLIARKVDGDAHARALHEMRRQALRLMELLEEFRPRLIGSVLTGHIRKGSDIDLHVYTDELEALCHVLEREGIPFEVEVVHTRKQGEAREFTHVRLPAGPTTGAGATRRIAGDLAHFEVEMTLYPIEALHEHPRCGITGRAMRRASIAEVRQLLATPATEVAPALVLEPPLSPHEINLLLPELAACRSVLQNHYHHLDVFEHTWAVVRSLEQMISDGFWRFKNYAEDLRKIFSKPETGSFLLLCGLCHDLGKPQTQSFARDGRIRFFDHDRVGAATVRRIGPRIGIDAATVDRLARVVEMHLEAVRIPGEDGEPSRIRRMMARVADDLPALAMLSMADVEAARGPAQSDARIEEHERFVDFLLEQYFEVGFLVNPTMPVHDDDLIEQFGSLEPHLLSELRESLTDAFVDGEFEGREEGLAMAVEMMSAPHWNP